MTFNMFDLHIFIQDIFFSTQLYSNAEVNFTIVLLLNLIYTYLFSHVQVYHNKVAFVMIMLLVIYDRRKS